MASFLASGIGAVGSLFGGLTGGKGAEKAAETQANAYKQGLAQQQADFNTVQANNAPYMAAGTTGLNDWLTLLGGNGATAQQGAITALQGSPQYTSEYNTGLNAILQNAAATGGLRGGNAALAQSNFGAQLLASLIGNQEGRYANLAQLGQAAAGGTNSAALSTGNNISNLLGQQGQAASAGQLAGTSALTSTLGNLAGIAGNYFGSQANIPSSASIMAGANQLNAGFDPSAFGFNINTGF